MFACWASAQAESPLFPGELLKMCPREGHWHKTAAEAGGDGKTICICLFNLPGWVKHFQGAVKDVLYGLSPECIMEIFPQFCGWESSAAGAAQSTAHSQPCVASMCEHIRAHTGTRTQPITVLSLWVPCWYFVLLWPPLPSLCHGAWAGSIPDHSVLCPGCSLDGC